MVCLREIDRFGGESGCLDLARSFYARVGSDSVLRPFFKGKSFRCASEELSSFLVQIMNGSEQAMQYRSWLSIRESHARFKIGVQERDRWLQLMSQSVASQYEEEASRQYLMEFFTAVASTLLGDEPREITDATLRDGWAVQQTIEKITEAIAAGEDDDAIALTCTLRASPSQRIGVIERMLQTRRPSLQEFCLATVQASPELLTARYNGRCLIHSAAMTGCASVLSYLISVGVDPNQRDGSGHPPLYRATTGEIVELLFRAGAAIDNQSGVSKATALHQAARFGNLWTAKALLSLGANTSLLDARGFTAEERAIRCRHPEVAALIREDAKPI